MHIRSQAQFISVSKLKNRGFTLIELLVSVAIITIITAVALIQHSQFNSTLALTNLAYEVGLSIRQAQVLGISVQEFQGSASDISYGASFTTATPSQYVVFADVYPVDGSDVGNGIYDAEEGEVVEGIQITRGNFVSDFCGITSGSENCDLREISILFERPNPDAVIYGVTQAGSGVSYESARIYLANPDGATRCVIVRSTGQVSVETTCPS